MARRHVSSTTWEARIGDTILPITAGAITIDELQLPAINSSIVVPYDLELLEALDPRDTVPPRVTVNGRYSSWAAKTLGDMDSWLTGQGAVTIGDASALFQALDPSTNTISDVTDAFGTPMDPGGADPDDGGMMSLSLHVREVETDKAGATMRISLASDEALLTDWAPTSGFDMLSIGEADDGLPAGEIKTRVEPFLRVVLGYGLTPGPYDSTMLSDLAPGAIFDWTKYSSAYDMFRPGLDDTNLKIRVLPGGGMGLFRPEGYINSPGTHSWLFEDEAIMNVKHTRSRSADWYDSAMLNNNDGSNSLGFPASGETHSRTYVEDLPSAQRVTTQMPLNVVTRASNRGEFIEITAPIDVTDGGVYMMDEFVYAPEDGLAEQWRVQNVTYDLLSDTMIIRGVKRY